MGLQMALLAYTTNQEASELSRRYAAEGVPMTPVCSQTLVPSLAGDVAQLSERFRGERLSFSFEAA